MNFYVDYVDWEKRSHLKISLYFMEESHRLVHETQRFAISSRMSNVLDFFSSF